MLTIWWENSEVCNFFINMPELGSIDSSFSADSVAASVKFYNWQKSGKYVSKIQITQNFAEAIVELKKSIAEVIQHIYTKRVQDSCYKNIKMSLTDCDLFIHTDYSESHKN